MTGSDETVLYIAELWQLLPEDAKRKGRSTPLEWGKLRTPADDNEGGVRHQMRCQAVKAMREGFGILGVYYDLLAVFGFARSAALRGWLINHDYQAATVAQIGQAIGCADAGFLGRAIRGLVKIGLLVRAKRPDFHDAIANDRTIRAGAAEPATPGVKGEPPPEGEKGAKERPSGAMRRRGHKSDRRRVSGVRPAGGRKLAGRRVDAGRTPGGRGPDAGRTPAGPGPSDVSESKNQRQRDSQTTRQRDSQTGDPQTPTTAAATASPSPQPLSAHGNGETSGDSETATARPAPAPSPDSQTSDLPTGEAGDTSRPAMPRQPAETNQGGDAETSDAGERQTAATTGPPASPDAQPRASPATTPPSEAAAAEGPRQADPAIADVELGAERHGAASVEAFVNEMMAVLYPTREDLLTEGRKAEPPQSVERFEARERGALASGIARAMRGLGQIGVVEMLSAGVKQAERLRRRTTRRPRGAVWLYWLARHRARGR
jgi:hypothetical protein